MPMKGLRICIHKKEVPDLLPNVVLKKDLSSMAGGYTHL